MRIPLVTNCPLSKRDRRSRGRRVDLLAVDHKLACQRRVIPGNLHSRGLLDHIVANILQDPTDVFVRDIEMLK